MGKRFDILDTPIQGLKIVQRKIVGDNRGYFERLFCVEDLNLLIPNKRIMQINHSLTEKRGTVRGMHFQYPPHAEFKFVSCLRGEVFDVAVDLRCDSPTFLKWHAEILTADNHKTLAIPEGFAHGFQTLTNECEMLYFHTDFYIPEAEDSLNVKDPILGIKWPVRITEISDRDQNNPFINDKFTGVQL